MMRKYPHAITQKCGKCGRTFTCEGTGWNLVKKYNSNILECSYANTGCNCGQCNLERGKGCEEIDALNEQEIVVFT